MSCTGWRRTARHRPEGIKINPWDIAAGCLLVTEAGGQVTAPAGSPFDLFARKIIASNGLIQNEMLEVLANSQPWPVPLIG